MPSVCNLLANCGVSICARIQQVCVFTALSNIIKCFILHIGSEDHIVKGYCIGICLIGQGVVIKYYNLIWHFLAFPAWNLLILCIKCTLGSQGDLTKLWNRHNLYNRHILSSWGFTGFVIAYMLEWLLHKWSFSTHFGGKAPTGEDILGHLLQ